MTTGTQAPPHSESSATAVSTWVRSWGASPQSLHDSVGAVEPFENATLRQVVRMSGGGRSIRIRIGNEYGTAPLSSTPAEWGSRIRTEESKPEPTRY